MVNYLSPSTRQFFPREPTFLNPFETKIGLRFSCPRLGCHDVHLPEHAALTGVSLDTPTIPY